MSGSDASAWQSTGRQSGEQQAASSTTQSLRVVPVSPSFGTRIPQGASQLQGVIWKAPFSLVTVRDQPAPRVEAIHLGLDGYSPLIFLVGPKHSYCRLDDRSRFLDRRSADYKLANSMYS